MASKGKPERMKKKEVFRDNLFGSDETFAFIAGYTSGGAPYGVTWDEMEEIERREKEKLQKQKQKANDIDLLFY